jgi:hypothetical protein
MGRNIWTAVYLINEGVSKVVMLFTVAPDENAAETNFHGYLDVKYGEDGVTDLAPEKIAEVAHFDESVDAMVSRLAKLGYEFVMPVREQVADDQVGRIVYAFLHLDEFADEPGE